MDAGANYKDSNVPQMSDTLDVHLHTGFGSLSVYFGIATFLRHNLRRKYNQLNPHNFKISLLFYRISLYVLTPHGGPIL